MIVGVVRGGGVEEEMEGAKAGKEDKPGTPLYCRGIVMN